MSRETADLKPLYLSEEEALSLLELFVLGQTETTLAQEQAMRKLANLTRHFLRSEQDKNEMEEGNREPFAFPPAHAVVFA